MKKIGLLTIGVLVISVLLNTNTGYFADAQSSQTFEVSEIGQLDTNGWAANVRVEGDTAFVADSDSGLYIIDVSNPENPTEVSKFNDSIDHIHELYVYDDLAYVADYTAGFKIINVSDPVNPTQVGMFHDGGEVGTFDIYEDLAFIADFVDGLEIVNISDPTNPTEMYQYNTGINYIFNVEVNNELAYVSDYISSTEKSIIILNISDLSNIVELAEYPIDGEVFSIDFVGNIAYMMCSYGGVKIFNISDPLDMTEIGSFYDGGNAVDLEFYDDYAMIADRNDGLEFLDISDLSNPISITKFYDGGNASGIAMVEDLLYIADGEDGLEILRIETITSTTSTTTTTTTTSTTTDSGLFIVLIGSVVLVGLVLVVIWRKIK